MNIEHSFVSKISLKNDYNSNRISLMNGITSNSKAAIFTARAYCRNDYKSNNLTESSHQLEAKVENFLQKNLACQMSIK